MATVTLCFYAQFTASKAGVNSLTVTWDIERITRADGTRSALQTGAATNITVGRRGLYGYYQTGCDLDLYDYVATAITADTSVDLKEVPALWTYWIADIADASVASVTGAVGSVTGNVGGNVAGSVASVSGAVGSVTGAVTVATNNDKTGYALTSAYDPAKTAASSADYTATRAAKLDNLDAAVTSRLAGASYSAPPSTAAIVAAMDASSADLDTLITNLSTLLARLTATRAGYLDNLTTPPLTATQTANAVLDGAAADHNTAGSIGAKINAAGAAADPLLNAVPGSYPTGTAGWSLGKIGSGGVTAVSPVAADGGTIDLVIGDDFRAADGTGLAWTIDKTGLPTGAASGTATFRLAHGGGTLTQTGTITDGTTAITVAVDLTAAQTGTLTPGEGAFSLTVVMAATSYTHTLTREGTATIRKAAGR